MENFMADQSRACGVVTGDGLLVSLSSAAVASSKLQQLDVQYAALMYRSFCALHGSDSDEYRAQRTVRFQQVETTLAEQLQLGGCAADNSNSDTASETASSSQHNAHSSKHVNANFFSLLVDERPLVDTITSSNGSSMVIETSDRTIECVPLVLSSGEGSSGNDAAPQVIFLVNCV
jgi:hypothetical protein